jgi:hypothetical protein
LRTFHSCRGEQIIKLRDTVLEPGHRSARANSYNYGLTGKASEPALREICSLINTISEHLCVTSRCVLALNQRWRARSRNANPSSNAHDYENKRGRERRVLSVTHSCTGVRFGSLARALTELGPIVGLLNFLRQTPQDSADALMLLHALS